VDVAIVFILPNSIPWLGLRGFYPPLFLIWWSIEGHINMNVISRSAPPASLSLRSHHSQVPKRPKRPKRREDQHRRTRSQCSQIPSMPLGASSSNEPPPVR